ncbi:MAG: BrnT family toxin [Treponema sp.]|nr:BrnT family toxin [Treponema sp.]
MGKTVISDDGRFEWDEAKNENNRKKHGFGFEEITDVFDDPYFLVRYDKNHSIDEERWNGIGCINRMLVLVTNFTERERLRINSAQRADNVLTEVYYDYIKKING